MDMNDSIWKKLWEDARSPELLAALLGLRELTGSPVTAAELETVKKLEDKKESGQ